MKLSIITPVYKDTKHLERFLEHMKEQTSKDYEIVLVVDTNNGQTLELIDEYRGAFKGRLKTIFNSKRFSRTAAINLGAANASGEYSIIMSLQNIFTYKFVEQALATIKAKGTDVIEFKAKFSAPIKFSGKIRKPFTKSTLIKENPEIHAYTFPFDFNKFFRTSVLVEAARYKLPVHLNSRFSIDATYLALLVAETYSTESKVFVTSKSKISENFNPLKMIRQWEALAKLVNDYFALETITRYAYAQYYSEVVFMSSFIKASKNTVVSKKFNAKFKKQQEGIFKDILDTNKYLMSAAQERLVFNKYNSPSQLHKAHKELD